MQRRSSVWKRFKQQYRLHLVMIPMALWAIVITFVPILGNVIAFQDYSIGKGVLGSPWVGLKHFQDFLLNPYTLQLLRNTFIMSVMGLIFGTICAVILAILINELRSRFFQRAVQTISYIPYFISMAVCANVFLELLGRRGMVNTFFQEIGLFEEAYPFLEKEEVFWIIMTIQLTWKNVGWNAIIYIAAIVGISDEVYEAAMMDGAGRFARIWHITISGILPTMIILLIMDSAKVLNGGMEQQLLMYNPSVMDVAEVINTYVYKRGMGNAEYSFSTAVSMFQSLVSIILLVTVNKIAKKTTEVALW